jgi:hypothetical protein
MSVLLCFIAFLVVSSSRKGGGVFAAIHARMQFVGLVAPVRLICRLEVNEKGLKGFRGLIVRQHTINEIMSWR